jgi:hypothetical protein
VYPVGVRAALVVLGLASAALAYAVGDSYTDRQSAPAGFLLVPVADHVADAAPRPRRTLVVVADGLRRDAALGMRATARLRAAGQCRTTSVSPPTISRPTYVTLSTGLGPDRTGVRSNDDAFPAPAQSVWQLARAAGMWVVARSEIAWFRELFPDGFDAYEVTETPLVPAPLGDLTLLHPATIDEAGHDHGGASPEYAAAVARLDRELGALLDRLDLAQDLVVLTADHGHTARGGHGGTAPEVARVLTCFAGRGVARAADGAMRARDVAPALALLLGLPFPREMRAGDDDLDLLWDVADARAFPAAYLADRRAALARFRAANPSWRAIYAEGRAGQALRLSAVAAVLGAGLAWAARRRGLGVVIQVAGVVAATLVLHHLARGSLDLSALNRRAPYIRAAAILCLAPALVALAARAALVRSLARAAVDQAAIVLLGLGVVVGHPLVFGWRLGFPLPPPFFFSLPYLSAIFTICHGLVLVVAVALARPRQAVPS